MSLQPYSSLISALPQVCTAALLEGPLRHRLHGLIRWCVLYRCFFLFSALGQIALSGSWSQIAQTKQLKEGRSGFCCLNTGEANGEKGSWWADAVLSCRALELSQKVCLLGYQDAWRFHLHKLLP